MNIIGPNRSSLLHEDLDYPAWPLPEGVSRLNAVFPTSKFTPPWDDIPAPFTNRRHGTVEDAWIHLFKTLFFQKREQGSLALICRPDIDRNAAWNTILDTVGSWGIKYEHKEAAVGYLLASYFGGFWFTDDPPPEWAESVQKQGEHDVQGQ